MYYYKIGLSDGSHKVIKSKKTNIELLALINKTSWMDYTLVEPSITYVGMSRRIETNVVMIRSNDIVSIEYCLDILGNL